MNPLYSSDHEQWRVGFGIPRKNNPVNIRSGPGLEFAIVGQIEKDNLCIVEWNSALAEDGWFPVRVHMFDRLGYIYAGWMLSTYIAFLPIALANP